MTEFRHQSLQLTENDKPLVYTAMSKHLFFMREHISRHVLEQGGVPLNPFMTFNYFLGDTVPRDLVRQANNVLVARADQLWQYGPVSDGALAEIIQAKQQKKLIRYFGIIANKNITELTMDDIELEDDVVSMRDQL